MRRLSLINIVILTVLLFALTACQPEQEMAVIDTLVPDSGQTAVLSEPVSTVTSAEAPDVQPTPAFTPSAVVKTVPLAAASPTVDLRLAPEDWRNWPVIPTQISQRAIEIYQKGLALGTDPQAFSIAGDCQAIKDVFFGEFDDQRKYYFEPAKLYLQDTIDNFKGSYNRDGTATRGGFTVASILSPLHADPDYCQPGETPLGCEFRLHNPSILIITLEVWRDPATVERYEQYMRQVLDESIAHGVLPILVTKADKAESREHVINPALAQLAYEYDIPLVNFWRAAQSLENQGLDPSRDFFHLSPEGWKVKSYTALEGLDTVWRAVNTTRQPEVPPQPVVTATLEPTTVDTVPSLAASFTCESECLLFGVVEKSGKDIKAQGVFRYEVDTRQMVEVLGEDFALEAVSPARDAVLVSKGSRLYLFNSTSDQGVLISADYFTESPDGAVFLNDSQQLAYIEGDNYANKLLTTGTGSPLELDTGTATPYQVYGMPADGLLYWCDAVCDPSRGCEPGSVWRSDPGKGSSEAVTGVMNPQFSPDGQSIAFMDPEYNKEFENEFNNLLMVEKLQEGLISRRAFYFPPANGFKVRHRLESYAWTPANNKLAVILDERSNYYERGGQLKLFIIHLDNGMMLDYERIYGMQPLQAWSTDSEKLVYSLMEHTEETGFSIKLVVLEPSTRTMTEHIGFDWTSSEFIYINRIYWMTPGAQ